MTVRYTWSNQNINKTSSRFTPDHVGPKPASDWIRHHAQSRGTPHHVLKAQNINKQPHVAQYRTQRVFLHDLNMVLTCFKPQNMSYNSKIQLKHMVTNIFINPRELFKTRRWNTTYLHKYSFDYSLNRYLYQLKGKSILNLQNKRIRHITQLI